MWQHLYEQSVGPMRDNAQFNLDRLDAADAVDAAPEGGGGVP